MNKLIESISNLTFANRIIRVWRQETELKDEYNNEDILLALFGLFKFGEAYSPAKIAEYISNLPRVNAVEVKNQNGQGIVIYNDWP